MKKIYISLRKRIFEFLSLKLYKVSIFNFFRRLNTFCRKQHFRVTIYFFNVKFQKLVFFSVFKSINGILHKTPFYKYNIFVLNYQFFNVFKGFTIFQIHLPLENKSMFLHKKVSFSIIFFEFPCFN